MQVLAYMMPTVPYMFSGRHEARHAPLPFAIRELVDHAGLCLAYTHTLVKTVALRWLAPNEVKRWF